MPRPKKTKPGPAKENGQTELVRAWCAVNANKPYTPRTEGLVNPLIILDLDRRSGENTMRASAGLIQFLLTESGNDVESVLQESFNSVIVVEFVKPVSEQEIRKEALLTVFGKQYEENVVRFLKHLNLQNATIVVRGSGSEFALKFAKIISCLTPQVLRNLIVLDPDWRKEFKRIHMVKKLDYLKNINVQIVFKEEDELDDQQMQYRSFFPNVKINAYKEISRENYTALVPLYFSNFENDNAVFECMESPDYDERLFDASGRQIYFSEICLQTAGKKVVQVCKNATETFQAIIKKCY